MISSLAAHTVGQFLSSPWIIVAIVLLIFGVGFGLLSKKIAEVTNTKAKFKVYLTISLILIVLGLGFMIIGSAVMSGLF